MNSYQITTLFIAYFGVILTLKAWYFVIGWHKKKQQKAEDYLTAIGVYDEKPIE